MPAPLPRGVAYTYAVDLSADEAPGVGDQVVFSEPLAFAVDNF